MNAYEKVIVALDYEELELARRLVLEIEDKISWFKVGPQLFTRSGMEIVSFLHQRDKNIFIDLKLHDTPQVVSETIRQIADLGAHFTTVHCLGGQRMLDAASQSCRGSRLQIIGLTLLTSHEATDTLRLGWCENESDITLRLLQMALESRLSGVMCSPHDCQSIRQKTLPLFRLITPGIRIPKMDIFGDDQNPKRVASPTQALDWGADFIVMGRPITQAREPKQVVEHLFDGGRDL